MSDGSSQNKKCQPGSATLVYTNNIKKTGGEYLNVEKLKKNGGNLTMAWGWTKVRMSGFCIWRFPFSHAHAFYRWCPFLNGPLTRWFGFSMPFSRWSTHSFSYSPLFTITHLVMPLSSSGRSYLQMGQGSSTSMASSFAAALPTASSDSARWFSLLAAAAPAPRK